MEDKERIAIAIKTIIDTWNELSNTSKDLFREISKQAIEINKLKERIKELEKELENTHDDCSDDTKDEDDHPPYNEGFD